MYGQRQRNNAHLLDGVMNMAILFNSIGIYPPPESLVEMKVESGISSGVASYSSGAIVNLVTKSGTNELHGDLWHSFRNDALDARSFFLPELGPFKWNQFGAAAGGPVGGGVYVYGYYEGIRLRQAANFRALVPTGEQLGGNFGGGPPIFNPFTTSTDSSGGLSRQPFANNLIPSSLINNASREIGTSLYPAPNLAAGVIPGVNFLNADPRKQDGDQFSVRVDHQFSPADSFSRVIAAPTSTTTPSACQRPSPEESGALRTWRSTTRTRSAQPF